jgi:FKBP-type peptidyl-prolyl cis-trans isomerase
LLYEIKLNSVKGTRLASDIATIDSYLQSHNIAAQQDGNGIRYAIDYKAQTSTTKPVSGDSIKVTYQEKKLADTLFTSVNTPTKIAWKDQVTAWRRMLPNYSTEGSTITMYTPSGYAYGGSGKGTIPPNSNMVFVVTLIEVIHH